MISIGCQTLAVTLTNLHSELKRQRSATLHPRSRYNLKLKNFSRNSEQRFRNEILHRHDVVSDSLNRRLIKIESSRNCSYFFSTFQDINDFKLRTNVQNFSIFFFFRDFFDSGAMILQNTEMIIFARKENWLCDKNKSNVR